MRLVRSLRIRNFRSLRQVTLDALEEYVTLLGPNGTGKSNFLRALSLFFNGYLDEEQLPVDLGRDFPDSLKNKKREVAITVEFDVSNYSVRDFTATLAASGISDTLVIERTWSYLPGSLAIQDQFRFGGSYHDLRDPSLAEAQALSGLIRSVQFRYIPNHVRPADLISLELQPLRKTIVSRLKSKTQYKKGGGKETLEALNEVAEDLFQSVSANVAKGTLQLKSVQPNLPGDFADVAFQIAIDAISATDTRQAPELQGSGTQSFILLHVLALSDRAERGLGFGWRQSGIWAIEEPESYLHAGLRSRFAADLQGMAKDPWRQVFITTHADEFVRVADTAFLITAPSGTTEVEHLPARDALLKSSKLRISSPVHPLLTNTDVPIVLVEGAFDYVYLRRALEAANRRLRWRLVEMSDIDDETGGGDAVISYLGANKQALRSRPDTAPVFVLRDWEDAKVGAINAALRPHAYSAGLKCPEKLANHQLGPSFKGIERYLSTAFVEATADPTMIQPANAKRKYPLEIRQRASRDEIGGLKQALVKQFQASAADPGPHLIALAQWLDDEVTDALGKIPPSLFVY